MNSRNEISPPKWAAKFLRLYCKKEFIEEIEGDIHEIFEVNLEDKGVAYAKRKFTWDVFRFLRWSNIKRLKKVQSNSFDMFKNYIKIAFRGLKRSKLYSVINISGLAVGMAVFMLIFLYVTNELSYDKYHSKSGQIHRIASHLTVPGSYFEFAIAPPNLGDRMVSDFPEVLNRTRLARFDGTLSYGDKVFAEKDAMYSDPEFFEFFDIPMLSGDAATALSEPFSLVLTEKAANKYFGSENALGKLIKVDGIEQPFSVRGVMANVPQNTHFDFNMLVSMETRKSQGFMSDTGQWFFLDYYTYLLFPVGYNPSELQSKMPDFVERNIGDAQRSANQTYEFEFQKLTDIHLKSHLDVEAKENGDIQSVKIFSIIAVFILVIACVNFMNLSISRSTRRAKEIGLRKVVGAVKRQLITQFLTESVLISFLSFVLAFFLVLWALPSFNTLIGQDLMVENLIQGTFIAVWPALILFIGFLAGFYPAIVLSGFKPINILKSGGASRQGGSLLKRVLVVFQLVISTILIIGTLVINRQLTSLQNQNLGFEKEQMLIFNHGGDGSIAANMETIRSEFIRNPQVKSISFTRSTPAGDNAGNWYTEYEVADGEMQNASMYGFLVDHEFARTYGLEFLAGRDFNRSLVTDMDDAFVVNESTTIKMGLQSPEEAIGKTFAQFGKKGKIIGVIKDFNYMTLHSAIEPLVIQLTDPQYLGVMSIKLEAGADLATIESLEEIWEGVITAIPFEVTFLDQALDNRYAAEMRTKRLFSSFSSLAIFIAALGLFALSTLSAEQQKRSISIRKVLGAPGQEIALKFSMAFLRLSVLALMISIPIAYLASESWLSNFNYRIDFDPVLFILGGLITATITLLTVSFQSFKITRINPAQNLRSE